MRKLVFPLLIFFPLFIFSQNLITIKKNTPIATTFECWEKMKESAVSQDQEYFKSLISELCVIILDNDIEVYLVEKKIWRGYAVLRVPGKSTKLYVNVDSTL